MSETTEKIYCMPENNNATELMVLMNGNNWNNNPFIYLIWLAFFGGNGFGWGNKNNDASQINEVSRQVATLADNINNNHNNNLALQAINGNRDALGQLAQTFNTDLSAITAAVADVRSAIQTVGGQVGYSVEGIKNAIALGDSNIMQQMQTCCCENKQLVTQMGYEGQIRDLNNTQSILGRLDALSNGISNGFSSTAYETQAQTSQLSRDLQNQTQTIIDKISTMEANAQQDKINTLTAQLTAANSRAERQAELQPIVQELNAIKCAQPSTVAVQYPQLSVYPSYLNTAYNNYNSVPGFWN